MCSFRGTIGGDYNMMRKLRQVKKMGGPMIVMIIMLIIGLVGSVTLMGLGGQQPPQTAVDPSLSQEEQIAFFEGLLEEYNMELTDNPDNQEAIGALAEIHWYLAGLYEDEEKQQEEMSNSLEYYQRLVELDPDNVNLITQTAVVAHTAGNDQLAHEHFNRALELDENNVNALANYGVYMMNSKGDFHGALAHFEKALEQEINDEAKEQLETFVTFATQMIEALENDSETQAEEEIEVEKETN